MKTPLKFLFGAAAGAIYGMAFSQKNGKKFRSELSKSASPIKTIWEEAKKMFQDSKSIVEKKSSKFEIDPMLKKMNLTPEQIKSFRDVIQQAKAKGGDALKQIKEQFAELTAHAEEPETTKIAKTTTKTEDKAEKKSAPKKNSTTKTASEKKHEFKNKVDEDKK